MHFTSSIKYPTQIQVLVAVFRHAIGRYDTPLGSFQKELFITPESKQATMNKPQLLKHLQLAAQKATPHKKLNGLHVRAITEELVNVWTKSLQETGTASFSGVGRFDVDKKTGAIKFKASTKWEDRIAGNISSSKDDDEENERD